MGIFQNYLSLCISHILFMDRVIYYTWLVTQSKDFQSGGLGLKVNIVSGSFGFLLGINQVKRERYGSIWNIHATTILAFHDESRRKTSQEKHPT